MKICKLEIENFRSIKSQECTIDELTALVGANGAGKSSVLRAIEFFYEARQLTDEDFYNRDISQEIRITITFSNLSLEAKKTFEKYINGNQLIVQKMGSITNGRFLAKYHGFLLKNPDFEEIRESLNAGDRLKTAKELLAKIKASEKYENLPNCISKDAFVSVLKEWEDQNTESCERARDDGQFLGFHGVGQGTLGRFTQLLSIPAVQDASSEASDKGRSAINRLMELVVRSVIAARDDYIKLSQETQDRFTSLMSHENLSELSRLEDNLSSKLQIFVRDASVKLNWTAPGTVTLPMPEVKVRLAEDGFITDVGKTGHGLQRAFVISLFQQLAATAIEKTNEAKESPDLPSLVLLIEEPELYQHPNRQRSFANILLELAKGKIPGVVEDTQIIYCTHSPFFVGIDRINQLRILRKRQIEDEMPKQTQICTTTVDALADKVWMANGSVGERFTGDTLLPRLQTIMTPWMNESFFADLAVLVEGEDDRAALLGIASFKGIDLESMGISVIPCGGKRNMDRPIAILKLLNIPVYAVWDGDKGTKDANPDDNKRLLRLFEAEPEDWPSVVTQEFAVFEVDLETTVKSELGDDNYRGLLKKFGDMLGFFKQKHAKKNPVVLSRLLKEAQSAGKTSPTLERIVDFIVSKVNQLNAMSATSN